MDSMSRWSLLDSVIRAIKACHDAAFILIKYYDLAKESSTALLAYAKYEEKVTQFKRERQHVDR